MPRPVYCFDHLHRISLRMWDYIPSRLRSHVEDYFHDTDGYWIHFDEFVLCPGGYHSIHAYSISEMRSELARSIVEG